MAAELPIAQGKQQCRLLLRMADRHGLIAGATGTGKTVTLRVIAEQLSQSGVAVRRLEEESRIIEPQSTQGAQNRFRLVRNPFTVVLLLAMRSLRLNALTVCPLVAARRSCRRGWRGRV